MAENSVMFIHLCFHHTEWFKHVFDTKEEKRPRMDPWGTPVVSESNFDAAPSALTFSFCCSDNA